MPDSQPRIQFAHTLRGVAALVVVLFHYAGVFWTWPVIVAGLINAPPATASGDCGWLTRVFAPRAYFSAGHFGVALFFLISGFVIPWSFTRQSRRGFAIARFLRLWPTYAAGLTCTLTSVWLAGVIFGHPFPYGRAAIAWHYALGLRDLVGSASIDGIVWTLEVEVRFYLLCLLIATALRRADARWVLVTILAVASVTGSIDGVLAAGRVVNQAGVTMLAALGLDGQMVTYMLIGTLFHLRFRGALRSFAWIGSVALAAAIFTALWSVGPISEEFIAGVASYAAALALFAVCYGLRDRFRSGGVFSWLADISYPMYAAHALPGYVVMRVAFGAGLAPLACLTLALAWAFGSAALIHRVIEAPSHELGRRWARRSGPTVRRA